MRLIQQSPAWSLHAYLRFLNIEYATENALTDRALGFKLPLIVDGINIQSFQWAANYYITEISADTLLAEFLERSLTQTHKKFKELAGTKIKEQWKALPLVVYLFSTIGEKAQRFLDTNR